MKRRKIPRCFAFSAIGIILSFICGIICTPSEADAAIELPISQETETRIVQHIPQTDEPHLPYTEFELDEMARIIACEAGSDWIPDYVQRYVGSVVLNRVNSPYFPNSIHDVLHDEGQYGPVIRGTFDTVIPNQRTIENAKYVLTYGSVLPPNVVYQDNYEQGDGIYFIYEDDYLGNTYFCYLN